LLTASNKLSAQADGTMMLAAIHTLAVFLGFG
jgi:hypothetical protein